MSGGSRTALVWFRRDLRLRDNPALNYALSEGFDVVPVYIWDPEAAGPWAPGAASQWWLHHSLDSLSRAFAQQGRRLVLRRGEALAALQELIAESGAEALFWNRRYEPWAIRRDTQIKRSLKTGGVTVQSFNGNYLIEPGSVQTQSGGPYKVFSAFWRTAQNQAFASLDRLDALPSIVETERRPLRSEDLSGFHFTPTLDWADAFPEFWSPGEVGATQALERFIDGEPAAYPQRRDFPGRPGVSRLSPHLAFGEVAPHRVLFEFSRAFSGDGPWQANAFVTELGWREFANDLLFHFPHTAECPLRPEFERFPWEENPEGWRAWTAGKTGYPIVDAGMRELWRSGWMHNRVRMIVASFLVKHLRIHWLEGARWFWDTLVDADLASNTLGWQWTAGCGADAAPYFRVFNPTLQAKRYDPDGVYVRRWSPGALGEGYPEPIVDHREARLAALKAFEDLKAQ